MIEIPNDPEKLKEASLDFLFQCRVVLDGEKVALMAKIKLVNDAISLKEEEQRKSVPANPLGVAKIGPHIKQPTEDEDRAAMLLLFEEGKKLFPKK